MPDEEPWVGSWRPHRPRGPIAALYSSPGPKYALPSLTGRIPFPPPPILETMFVVSSQNMHSFFFFFFFIQVLHYMIRQNTKAAPAHSLYGRSKNGKFMEDYTKSPGPAAYQAVDPQIYLNKSPQYSMPGRKFMPQSATRTPAPGVTTTHTKAPAFTFGLRHSQYTICPIMDADKYQQSFSFL
uniref:Ciliary microtubule associated protein 1B n=1 Tax=Hippocampus comes TaxID=109280 RepID=A0A3Q2YGR6_HIPCM